MSPWYISGAITFVFTTFLTLRIPQLTQEFIDRYLSLSSLSSSNSVDITQAEHSGAGVPLSYLAFSIAAIGALIVLSRTASRVLILWQGRVVETQLREEYFGKSLRFTQQSLEAFSVGDLISRMSTDMRQIGFMFGFGVVQILNFLVTGLYVIYSMASIHVWLTVLVMIPVAANSLIFRIMVPKLFKHAQAQQKGAAELSSHISEAFYNVHAIRAAGAISSFQKLIEASNASLYKTTVRQLTYRAGVMPSLQMVTHLAYVVVFFYGGSLVIGQDITLGELTAFNAYIAILTLPLVGLGLSVAAWQRAKTASGRLDTLDDSPTERTGGQKIAKSISSGHILDPGDELDQKSATSSRVCSAIIEFCDLSFRYPTEQTGQILKGVNGRVYRGKHFGVVGEIGSGKTTLFKILLGYYPPTTGSYKLYGQPAETLSLEDIRRTIGWVSQDTYFFSESIRYNLTLSDQSLSAEAEDAMIEACRQADIYNEIMSFPGGFDSHIGEDGIKLSGGQKQRLSLARALWHPREIYLLDDVFSALDHSTEETIIHNLSKLPYTFIIVSHRPSVLQFCDQIAVLEDGRFSALGSYDELCDHPLLQNVTAGEEESRTPSIPLATISLPKSGGASSLNITAVQSKKPALEADQQTAARLDHKPDKEGSAY